MTNEDLEAVMKVVDERAETMTPEDYHGFLACLISDLAIRKEAVEQELADS